MTVLSAPSPEDPVSAEEYLPSGTPADPEVDPVDLTEQQIEVDLGEDEL